MTIDPSRLNPYEDPGPWGFVDVGNLRLPGVVEAIDGHEKPEEWKVQKATSKSNATTVWQGTNVAESIVIDLALPNAKAFNAYYDVARALRPKIGTKPPSHPIVNPAINFSDITRVSCRNVGPPRWDKTRGLWTARITLIEYSPEKPANTGPASPSDYKNPGKDPNQDLKDEAQKILDQAAKAA